MLSNQLKKPVLLSYFLSSCSWRVRLALNLKNVQFDYEPVDLLKKSKGEQFSEEFTKLNPKQEVPVLYIDGFYLTQSIPIIEYLNETRQEQGINLLPNDPIKKARSRTIAEIINSGIQPYQNANTIKKIYKEMGKEKQNEWLKFYLEKGLNSVEVLLKETKGKYSIGDEISIADLCLVPQVFSAIRYGIILENYPLIYSINSELEKIPEFIKAHPSNQIDCTDKFKIKIN